MKKGFGLKIILFFSIIFLLNSLLIAAEDSELKNIRFVQKDDRLEVTIEVSGEFGFDTFSLIGPKRLVIDLSPIQSIKALPSITVNACGVLRIRCGQFKPDVARVVFDLAEKVPSHKISRIAEGLQVLFWQEEQVPAAVVVPEVREEAQVVEKKPGEKPVPVPPPPAAAAKPQAMAEKRATFLRLQGGLSVFPMALISTQKELVLYGEAGSLSEEYKASLNLAFGLSAARAVKVKEKEAKLGADFFLWSLSHKGLFEASIPHPFIASSPRQLAFEEKLSNSLFQIGAFFLYPILERKEFNLWLGPAVGYTFGKLTTLEDFNIEERPPYTSDDLILTDTILIDDSVGDFIFELRMEFNYALTPRTSFFALASFSYFNPKVNNLGKRVKFISLPLSLGLEFRL